MTSCLRLEPSSTELNLHSRRVPSRVFAARFLQLVTLLFTHASFFHCLSTKQDVAHGMASDGGGDGKATAHQARSAMLRLASDWRSIQADPPSGCSASPVSEDNLFLWTCTIVGPDESPWEGEADEAR